MTSNPSSSNDTSPSATTDRAAGGVDADAVARALTAYEASKDRVLDDLVRLSRIPSVSARPVPDRHVRASAVFVADLMRATGLTDVELLEIPGAHPYVLGHR